MPKFNSHRIKTENIITQGLSSFNASVIIMELLQENSTKYAAHAKEYKLISKYSERDCFGEFLHFSNLLSVWLNITSCCHYVTETFSATFNKAHSQLTPTFSIALSHHPFGSLNFGFNLWLLKVLTWIGLRKHIHISKVPFKKEKTHSQSHMSKLFNHDF